MASLANINIKFSADLKAFSTTIQNAERQLKKVGRSMQKVGKGLTVGVTAPLLALGVAGVRAWDKQEKAIAQVNAGLKTTAGAVGFTSEQLQKMAADLQNNSLFGDEEILKNATAQLLTFTNIANTQFARTQQAALDLATRLGGDLKSASIQLGKALNDPVANLSALSRSGIQFSADQKKVINSLVKTNHLADAQTIILNELEKQYGGSAAAAAKAGLGPFQQLGNILGDLNEDFGAIIADAILPFVEKVKSIAKGFKELSPETKKFIVIIAGIAAAIGPLLALAGTILPAIVSGFALLTGPVGLVVAALTAIGIIIVKNWKPIKQILVDIANYFIDLYNESTIFRFAVDGITLTFKNMWTGAKFVFNALVSILKFTADAFIAGFKAIGTVIKGALTLDLDVIKKGWQDYKKSGIGATSDLISNLKANWETFTVGVGENIRKSIENAGARSKIVLKDENIVDQTTNPIVGTGRKKASTIKTKTIGFKTNINYNRDLLKNEIRRLEPLVSKYRDLLVINPNDVKAKKKLNKYIDLINGYKERLEVNAINIPIKIDTVKIDDSIIKMQQLAKVSIAVSDSVANAFADMSNRFIDSLDLADHGFQGFVKNIAKTITQLIAQMLAAALSQSIAGATAAGVATGPLSIFTTPAFIATAIGGVLAAFAAIPKFAEGGIVTGPTVAMLGEYPGASSNPEVIAPLNKLRNLINPQGSVTDVNVHGVFEVEGRKLRLVLDRTDKQLGRTV